MDWVAGAAGNVALGPASQEGFDGLHSAKAAGNVERSLPAVVQLVHARAQARTQHLVTTEQCLNEEQNYNCGEDASCRISLSTVVSLS